MKAVLMLMHALAGDIGEGVQPAVTGVYSAYLGARLHLMLRDVEHEKGLTDA